MLKKQNRMKWILFLFFPLTLSAFSIVGIWKPKNYRDFTINVEKDNVYGVMNRNPYIEMKLVRTDTNQEGLIKLEDIKIIQKPSDWYNITKYKPYIKIFQKVKESGKVECRFSFLDEDRLMVEPQVGKEKYRFILCREKK